jgi:hypothetical protein
VHGGALATLVDMAMGAAVRSSTGESDVPATSQLTVTYLRPGKPGRLVVTAEVRKQGEHLTVCEADVEQDGSPLCTPSPRSRSCTADEPAAMKVSWDQVHAWRLRRQFVDPRGDADAVGVAGRLCGVQAQMASAAELAVRLRQSAPGDGAIERGLADGALIKTWAMRGTLHVLRPSQAAACLALIASARTWEKGAWQRVTGTTPAQIQALVEVVSELLDGAYLTRDELVTKLAADKRFAPMEEKLRSGWGSMLKPIAWQGALCHGPSRGHRVTFTRPDTAWPLAGSTPP